MTMIDLSPIDLFHFLRVLGERIGDGALVNVSVVDTCGTSHVSGACLYIRVDWPDDIHWSVAFHESHMSDLMFDHLVVGASKSRARKLHNLKIAQLERGLKP